MKRSVLRDDWPGGGMPWGSWVSTISTSVSRHSAKGDPLDALNSIVPFESFRAEYIPNLARTLL
jgi:hypothetical protein